MATGFSTAFANDVLELFFMAVAVANLAQNNASAPATTITWALHTSTGPAAGGTQTTNETAYTGYARQTNTRDATGWTTTNNVINNDANVDFPECTASPGGAITQFSLGTGVSNYMMAFGDVSPQITMAVGVIPRLTTATSVTIANT